MAGYLHERKDFPELIQVTANEMPRPTLPYLVEKDYWIMHVLFGLQQAGFDFELKGGTSLSKGFKIIGRFSEDIDILIHPPESFEKPVYAGRNQTKEAHIQSRKDYYDWLADHLKIPGIIEVFRDVEFDDTSKYFSGGIRLLYPVLTDKVAGVKDGILLEVGFDTVSPNRPVDMSAWTFDRAADAKIDVTDNRAMGIKCYLSEYTFVEKLQAIIRKFAQEQSTGRENQNFLRQYYDVYELLGEQAVIDFIGTDAYLEHKARRFNLAEQATPLAENDAFNFRDRNRLAYFRERFRRTEALYYEGQPDFEVMLERIHRHLPNL